MGGAYKAIEMVGTSGQSFDDAVRQAVKRAGETMRDLEWIEVTGGTRSPLDTPLWEVIESFIADEEPEAKVAPDCLAGFTDSHWLREAFGTTAYGFFPARMPPELMASLIHSADERIPVDDLELGVEWLRYAARLLCGG